MISCTAYRENFLLVKNKQLSANEIHAEERHGFNYEKSEYT